MAPAGGGCARPFVFGFVGPFGRRTGAGACWPSFCGCAGLVVPEVRRGLLDYYNTVLTLLSYFGGIRADKVGEAAATSPGRLQTTPNFKNTIKRHKTSLI